MEPIKELLQALKSTYETMTALRPLEIEGSEGALTADETINNLQEAITNIERTLSSSL